MFLQDRPRPLQSLLLPSKKPARVAPSHSLGVYQSLRNILLPSRHITVTEKYSVHISNYSVTVAMKGTWTQTVHVFSLLIYFLNHLCLTHLGMWDGQDTSAGRGTGSPRGTQQTHGCAGNRKAKPPDPVSSFSPSPAAPLSALLAKPGPPLFLLKTPRKHSSSS